MKKYRMVVKRDDQRNYSVLPVEAIEWTGENYHQVTDFLDARTSRWQLARMTGPLSIFDELVLRTPGYASLVSKGDIILRNIQGTLEVMKQSLFTNLYEEVNE